MHGLLMTLRIIWNGGVFDEDGVPEPITRPQKCCPARLLSLLNDPQPAEYESFEALEKSLREECLWPQYCD
jgi:hypothetical protein